jgi:hypothetical protein
MLKNLSPTSAGTMSHKFFIWKTIDKRNSVNDMLITKSTIAFSGNKMKVGKVQHNI